jgi:hypothetical protein
MEWVSAIEISGVLPVNTGNQLTAHTNKLMIEASNEGVIESLALKSCTDILPKRFHNTVTFNGIRLQLLIYFLRRCYEF